MNIDILIIKRFIMKVYPFMILCSTFIEQNKLVRKIQYEWISQPIQLLFTRQLLCDLVLICVQRLATSAYKPARLGKSLLLGLSRRSGQTYPLVADRVASQPCFYFTFSITSFAATSPVLTGATSA